MKKQRKGNETNDFKVDGSAGRGRPRKSWLECVNVTE